MVPALLEYTVITMPATTPQMIIHASDSEGCVPRQNRKLRLTTRHHGGTRVFTWNQHKLDISASVQFQASMRSGIEKNTPFDDHGILKSWFKYMDGLEALIAAEHQLFRTSRKRSLVSCTSAPPHCFSSSSNDPSVYEVSGVTSCHVSDTFTTFPMVSFANHFTVQLY